MLTQQSSLNWNPNISKTVSHSIISNTIYWESFRCIYVNYFSRLRFPAEVNTKLQKVHFFVQFKDHNSSKKNGNWTNDPIFFHLLFPLKLFVTFISQFENSQNSFSSGLSFGPIWSEKKTQFLAKSCRFGQPITIFSKQTPPGYWKSILCFAHPPEPNTRFFGLMDY